MIGLLATWSNTMNTALEVQVCCSLAGPFTTPDLSFIPFHFGSIMVVVKIEWDYVFSTQYLLIWPLPLLASFFPNEQEIGGPPRPGQTGEKRGRQLMWKSQLPSSGWFLGGRALHRDLSIQFMQIVNCFVCHFLFSSQKLRTSTESAEINFLRFCNKGCIKW